MFLGVVRVLLLPAVCLTLLLPRHQDNQTFFFNARDDTPHVLHHLRQMTDKRIMSITNIPELVAVSEKSIAGIEIAAPRLHGEDAHSMHHAHVPAY